MTKSNVSYVLKLGLILLLITVIVAGLLAFVNSITKDQIAELKEQKVADAIALVLPSEAKPEDITPSDAPGEMKVLYQLGQDGYCAEMVVSGSQGTIDFMVGLTPEGTVTGVSIVSHSETAGLGAVYAGDTPAGVAFRGSFVGQDKTFTKEQMDYKTGATVSAEAIRSGVVIACDYVAGLE